MRKSPCTPLRVKAKGKEINSGFFEERSKSARACARERGKTAAERYSEAGDAAAELTRILGVPMTQNNFRIWAWYCYRHDIGIIFDKAYECASRKRQGEIRFPERIFQRWLSKSYGKKNYDEENGSGK